MIKFDNLTFEYKKKRRVFTDFSLQIEEGKIYGLLGQNGAGKSTLLYLMSGLLRPQKGSVTFQDSIVSKRLPSALKEIFIVPEEFDLPAISLKKYVELNSVFYPKFDQEQMANYLKCFDMPADLDLGGLSMGQKKKVYMSFALATNTSLLIMDEPTNGLDIPSKSQFRKFMALGMNDQKTIIISTHQVQDVDKMLEHIIIIDDSNILLDQPVANITNKLCFVEGEGKIDSADILYMLPTISGNSVMRLNKGGEETPLNLELLYNAIVQTPESVSKLFNNVN